MSEELVLAIDTSTLTASVAVARGAEILALCDERAELHSDVVLPLIERMLQDASVEKRAITRIAVGIGPGSFTGLRIGLATAKGLAFARSLEVWGCDSLMALAWSGRGALRVPMVDARRGEVFLGAYQFDENSASAPTIVRAPAVMAPADVGGWIAALPGRASLCGDALVRYPELAMLSADVCSDARATPSAAGVALLAVPPDLRRDGAPFYIRPSEAEIKYPDGVPGAAGRKV